MSKTGQNLLIISTNYIKTIKATTLFVVFLFVHSWEQRKLGELSSLITKGTTPLDKNNSGIVNFVKIESIDESSGDITITQRISIDEHNGYLRRSQLKENDILFSIAGTLGRVTSVKSSILPANTNQALAIIRLKDGCLDYVKTYLKGKAVAEFIKKNPTIGAQPNLSLEQVANLEIAIPSVSEQVKIGNYFEKLDNLITLHQREFFRLILAFFCCNSTSILPISWEQRKLGELSSLITKGTTPLDKNNSGIVNFVKIESIDESSGDITITQRISIDEHNGYLRRSQLKENDILFSIAGTLGRVTSVKSSILPANTNQALAIIRLKDGCLDYVKTYLKGKAVAEFIKKNPTIGAQPNLSLEQVANLEIAIPSVSEQVKIGNYFEKLDNLITLHQREFFRLILAFFCCNSTSILPISWEQCKLSDIAERFDNLRIPVAANLRIAGSTPYYGANGIQDYVDGYTHDGEFVLVAEDGANDLKNYPVQYVKGRIWVNNHAHVLQGKAKILDNRFLTYVINQADIESLLVGCGRAKLNAETMMNIVLPIPAIKEQQIIGCCLSKLDNLITLHQRQLEKLKNIKSALLEKMFV